MSATFKLNPQASAAVQNAARRALKDAGEALLEDANRKIPHEIGDMERSGLVTQRGNEVAVSYDTPYAVRQHEDTRLRHDEGREAKWLERSLNRKAKALTTFIGDAIKAVLR